MWNKMMEEKAGVERQNSKKGSDFWKTVEEWVTKQHSNKRGESKHTARLEHHHSAPWRHQISASGCLQLLLM